MASKASRSQCLPALGPHCPWRLMLHGGWAIEFPGRGILTCRLRECKSGGLGYKTSRRVRKDDWAEARLGWKTGQALVCLMGQGLSHTGLLAGIVALGSSSPWRGAAPHPGDRQVAGGYLLTAPSQAASPSLKQGGLGWCAWSRSTPPLQFLSLEL